MAVLREKLLTPSRETERSWTTVRRKPAVVIAAMTAQQKLVLIRQERIPIRATIWEMPAGQVDELCNSQSLKEVAVRELREETGYELAPHGSLEFLGDFFSSPGFTDERAFLFLARPVEPSAAGHAHHESEAIVDCREVPVRELQRMIAADEVRDANTLAAFARLCARGIISIEA